LAANIPTVNCSTCDVQRIAKVAVFLAGKVCAIVTISIPGMGGAKKNWKSSALHRLVAVETTNSESGWMSAMRPRQKAGIVTKSMVEVQ
jgi:hypothetical protein